MFKEIINKWKMLETIDEKREVSEFDLNLVNLMDEIVPLRSAIDYISSICKEHTFESIEALESRIGELEDKALSLSEILTSIKEQKRIYNAFLENAIDITRDESLVLKLKNEISSVEEYHKSTSVDVKIKINKLDSLHTTWSKLEICLVDLHAKFAHLDQKSSYLAQFKRASEFGDEQKLLDQLGDIKSSINEYKTRIDSFRNQIQQQQQHTHQQEQLLDHFTPYGAHLLKLDKFIFKFNGIIESLNQTRYIMHGICF